MHMRAAAAANTGDTCAEGAPRHRLVVARFAENLDWIARVPAEFDVLVFNKGAPVASPAALGRARIIDRPNIGREGETYLSYIANAHTGAGPGFTVFTQGDPFEHSPDFLHLLACPASWQDVQPLSWRWKSARDIPPAHILAAETGDFVQGLRVRPELFSLSSWAPVGFDDAGTQWLNAAYRRVHGLPEGVNIAAHFFALCGLQELQQAALAHRLGLFAYGAVFAARNDLVAGFTLSALPRLRQACCGHSVYGYVLERVWLHLFGLPFSIPMTPPGRLPVAVHGGEAFCAPETAASLRRQRVRRAVDRIGGLVARR
jgi:hypothetical protein